MRPSPTLNLANETFRSTSESFLAFKLRTLNLDKIFKTFSASKVLHLTYRTDGPYKADSKLKILLDIFNVRYYKSRLQDNSVLSYL